MNKENFDGEYSLNYFRFSVFNTDDVCLLRGEPSRSRGYINIFSSDVWGPTSDITYPNDASVLPKLCLKSLKNYKV